MQCQQNDVVHHNAWLLYTIYSRWNIIIWRSCEHYPRQCPRIKQLCERIMAMSRADPSGGDPLSIVLFCGRRILDMMRETNKQASSSENTEDFQKMIRKFNQDMQLQKYLSSIDKTMDNMIQPTPGRKFKPNESITNFRKWARNAVEKEGMMETLYLWSISPDLLPKVVSNRLRLCNIANTSVYEHVKLLYEQEIICGQVNQELVPIIYIFAAFQASQQSKLRTKTLRELHRTPAKNYEEFQLLLLSEVAWRMHRSTITERLRFVQTVAAALASKNVPMADFPSRCSVALCDTSFIDTVANSMLEMYKQQNLNPVLNEYIDRLAFNKLMLLD